MRIAFDVGGAISKYPEVFKALISALEVTPVQVYVLSDMHPHQKIMDMLALNGIRLPPERVVSADWQTHGEACKSEACARLGIDLLVDDFPGYVAGPHPAVRLMVMPDPSRPYYADQWVTDGSEGNFGRRRKVPPA